MNEGTVVDAPEKEVKPNTAKRRGRPSNEIRIKLFVGKEFIKRFKIENSDKRRGDTTVYHAYPLLSDWVGRALPDEVNPRSHDEDATRSSVAKDIETTLLERPDDFIKANRGATVVADKVDFDEKTGNLEIVITDPENQGVCDGGTTDAVIAKVQRQLLEGKAMHEVSKADLPEVLRQARLHVEIWTGIKDRDEIVPLVSGRNTSRQVKGWSLADYQGKFDWLKDDVFGPESQFHDKIGYEENASCEMNVLGVLALMTLFHPEYDEKTEGPQKTPVIAYSSKGRLNDRLKDEISEAGYKNLKSITADILDLYEYIYSTFDNAYNKAFGKGSRLGRRHGVTVLEDRVIKLPLTGRESSYRIPSGYLYPVLAAFRAIVGYKRDGTAFWRVDPKKFWDERGHELVKALFHQADEVGGNPNRLGKTPTVYTALHDKARLIYMESKNGGKE